MKNTNKPCNPFYTLGDAYFSQIRAVLNYGITTDVASFTNGMVNNCSKEKPVSDANTSSDWIIFTATGSELSSRNYTGILLSGEGYADNVISHAAQANWLAYTNFIDEVSYKLTIPNMNCSIHFGVTPETTISDANPIGDFHGLIVMRIDGVQTIDKYAVNTTSGALFTSQDKPIEGEFIIVKKSGTTLFIDSPVSYSQPVHQIDLSSISTGPMKLALQVSSQFTDDYLRQPETTPIFDELPVVKIEKLNN